MSNQNNLRVTMAEDGRSFSGKATAAMVRGLVCRIKPSTLVGKTGVFVPEAELEPCSGTRGGLLERDVLNETKISLDQIVYGDAILTPELVGAHVSCRIAQEYEVEGSDLIQATGAQALTNATPADVELTTLAGKVALRVAAADLTISANTLANPTVVTTTAAHGLTTGQTVVISGSNSTPSIDGFHQVTVISPTTFSVPVNVTTAGTAGNVAMLQDPTPELYGWLRGQLTPLDSDNDCRLLVEVAA